MHNLEIGYYDEEVAENQVDTLRKQCDSELV